MPQPRPPYLERRLRQVALVAALAFIAYLGLAVLSDDATMRDGLQRLGPGQWLALLGLSRCRPWRAKRRPVVPGRRRRGRLAGVAEGRSPEAAEARCKRIRYAVKPFDVGPWRSPTAPMGARRDVAVARSGANRGTMVVAERKAKGGLGRPVSHPEHGDTPTAELRPALSALAWLPPGAGGARRPRS